MSIITELEQRSGGQCELCQSTEGLQAFEIPMSEGQPELDATVHLCATCHGQAGDVEQADLNHWRSLLNDAIWSPVPGVQVLSYRMLQHFRSESWASSLLDSMYLDDETLAWAKAGLPNGEAQILHKDSNGTVLEAGDTVHLIKDLNVKGANFTAKRGTAVRRIRLVPDNPEHIEGKVEGQQIVILTKFVKKSK